MQKFKSKQFYCGGSQQANCDTEVKGFTECSLDVNFTQLAFKNAVPTSQKYAAFQLEKPIS